MTIYLAVTHIFINNYYNENVCHFNSNKQNKIISPLNFPDFQHEFSTIIRRVY